MRQLRLGMAQINATVGDFPGNTEKIFKYIDKARTLGVDLLTFPELAISGYPPEDLLFKPQFIEENTKALQSVIERCVGLTVFIGFIDAGEGIFNAAAVIHDCKLVDVYRKMFLPNYGVFDENRYFRPGTRNSVYIIDGIGVGLNICEDIWYESGPASAQANAGAEVIVNISSSPYNMGKGKVREEMLAVRSTDNTAIVAYNNMVGGQDELVFDGGSLILDEKGQVIARGKQFEEDFITADLDVESVFRTRLLDPRWRKTSPAFEENETSCIKIVVSTEPEQRDKPILPQRKHVVLPMPAEVYSALVLGTRDYIKKNGFKKVVIGLSGGVDSSMVAAVAADALGSEGVIGVSMPSRYSSSGSKSDAEKLAENLGIKLMTISIEKVFQSYLDTLEPSFRGANPNSAEENIQARIRGNLLMALSNKFGWLVLTTGNKSEYATGYTTLYGDMAGGFAVLKDVPKTLVYQLAEFRNKQAGHDFIPQTVIDKPPSAELRPNQKDTDSLPPYDVLDPILAAYVEEDKSVEQIIAAGTDEAFVKKATRLVDGSEYKRRQAPPGVKITLRAFGRDRRLPITNRFKGW